MDKICASSCMSLYRPSTSKTQSKTNKCLELHYQCEQLSNTSLQTSLEVYICNFKIVNIITFDEGFGAI